MSDMQESAPATGRLLPRTWGGRLLPYLGAGTVTAAALVLALQIKTYLFIANVALVFLAGVVLCAVQWGMRPALFACVLSVMALNFFFFPPIHDLRVEDPENVFAVLIFVAVAVFVGRLAAQARAAASLAEKRAQITGELYGFGRQLTGIDELNELVRIVARQINVSVGVDVVVLLLERNVIAVRATVPPLDEIGPEDLAEAEECLGSDPASRNAKAARRYLFLPMLAAGEPVGVIGIRRNGQPPALPVEEGRFVEAVADQAAVSIKRLTLHADVESAHVAAETERLRSAMLSAISHDLKTPLASILGAATSLGSYNSYFEQQARDELVATIREEAQRMSRFIANLLDITRLDSGTLEVQKEATDIGEVVGAAARRGRQILGGRRLQLRVAPDLPLVELDAVILEQTLFNLLDNAAKYSPPQTTITIEAMRAGKQAVIRVLDEGPGIPPQDVRRIFERFYRSSLSGGQRAGTGLGLAICHGFIEAMGGRIIAGNRTDRSGAVFMINFPLPAGLPDHRPLERDDD